MEKAVNSVNLNSKTDFPYLVLNVKDDTSYPLNPGFRVMHWHNDLQFIYVKEGNAGVKTLDKAIELRAGEGIFINKNVIHMVYKIGKCRYNSFIFPDYFIKFYPGCPAGNLVTAVTENTSVGIVKIDNSNEWSKKALCCLRNLCETENNKNEFYEYKVLVSLCSLWLCFVNSAGVENKGKAGVTNERMEKFLRYIQENYSNNISLSELAESGNVSKSECLRCFKASLDTTPARYIMDFRLYKGAELLRNSDMPIQNIADITGFGQASYFGKCFKEKTGMSPKEYRNMNN